MAKLKRYDLYEGDDDLIQPSLPGRQPLGRDEDLREKDAYQRRSEAEEKKRRYFASNEKDDGLGAPSTLFDDFDRFETQAPDRQMMPKKRKKKKNRGKWAAAALVCLILLACMALAVLPQLTGIRYRFLPNLAFVNGSLISLDHTQYETFLRCRNEIYTDRIYQGVFIDNVNVGGMTREEAAEAVKAVHNDAETAFDIMVSVGNESWHVNSERVPVSRNIADTVERAWATGRGMTSVALTGAATPFQAKIDRASDMRSHPETFATKQDYDHEALRMLTDGIVNYVNRDPVNSMVQSFDFNTTTFSFTEDVPGAFIDPDMLYAQLTEILDSGTVRKEIRVVPEKKIAEVTRT